MWRWPLRRTVPPHERLRPLPPRCASQKCGKPSDHSGSARRRRMRMSRTTHHCAQTGSPHEHCGTAHSFRRKRGPSSGHSNPPAGTWRVSRHSTSSDVPSWLHFHSARTNHPLLLTGASASGATFLLLPRRGIDTTLLDFVSSEPSSTTASPPSQC